MKGLCIGLLGLALVGCGGGFARVDSADTERVYDVKHSAESKLAAFDQLDEWIALEWNSAQDVVQTKNERTGTFVVKWLTVVSVAGQPITARSSALIKATEAGVTFTLRASPGPGAQALTQMVLEDVYVEWDRMMANTPWGAAAMTKKGYVAPGDTGACRSDRDCSRRSRCSSGQCVAE